MIKLRLFNDSSSFWQVIGLSEYPAFRRILIDNKLEPESPDGVYLDYYPLYFPVGQLLVLAAREGVMVQLIY